MNEVKQTNLSVETKQTVQQSVLIRSLGLRPEQESRTTFSKQTASPDDHPVVKTKCPIIVVQSLKTTETIAKMVARDGFLLVRHKVN